MISDVQGSSIPTSENVPGLTKVKEYAVLGVFNIGNTSVCCVAHSKVVIYSVLTGMLLWSCSSATLNTLMPYETKPRNISDSQVSPFSLLPIIKSFRCHVP